METYIHTVSWKSWKFEKQSSGKIRVRKELILNQKYADKISKVLRKHRIEIAESTRFLVGNMTCHILKKQQQKNTDTTWMSPKRWQEKRQNFIHRSVRNDYDSKNTETIADLEHIIREAIDKTSNNLNLKYDIRHLPSVNQSLTKLLNNNPEPTKQSLSNRTRTLTNF